MKYADNIREVAQLLPDFMGFIFYPNSKRFVGNDFAMPEISSSIKKTGIFVNENQDNILIKVEKYKLDFVQLHGNESAEFCHELFRRLKHHKSSAGIIKAFGIDELFDFSSLDNYQNSCEYFLFDTKTNNYGGSGRSFDKNILNYYKLSKPFFISGGIGLEEVKSQKLKLKNCFALDVNSKFENESGLKDIHKLKLLKDELSGQ